MKSLAFDFRASKEDLKGKHTECAFEGKEPSTSHVLYASTLSACNSFANELSEIQQSLATEIEKKKRGVNQNVRPRRMFRGI